MKTFSLFATISIKYKANHSSCTFCLSELITSINTYYVLASHLCNYSQGKALLY